MGIRLSDLIRSKLNVRRDYAPEIVSDLAASIMVDGLLSRIVLRASEEQEGKYEVLAGGRRFEALKSINELDPDYLLPEDYYVVRDVTDFEGICISVSENVQRVSFSTDELTDAVRIMKGLKPSITTKEIAQKLWETEARVKRVFGVSKDYDDIPDRVKDEFKKSIEESPLFTDAHWDSIKKQGVTSFGEDTVKDVCDYIMDNEIPPSKTKVVVDKFCAKSDVTKGDDPESSSGKGSSDSAPQEDNPFEDKFKGELKLVDEDGKEVLYCISKKEDTVVEVENYKNYLKNPEKFKVYFQGKITIKPIEI